MGWKKNRQQGELAFEGGILGLPMINELASAFVDVMGVTGQAGSDVINVLQEPVTGTALEDMQVTENFTAEDIAKLVSEIGLTGGSSLIKGAPKAASLVDDLVKNAGNKTITVPVPTGVGSASGGAKVKIKDIAEAAVEGAKKTGKVVKEQIAPLRLGGKEGSFARKFINTTMLPMSGKSGTLYSKFNYPKFPYFQTSTGTMADYLVTGAKNIPSAVGNMPTAFLQSRFGTLPSSYAMYRGLTADGDPKDAYGPVFDFSRGVTGGMYDYYLPMPDRTWKGSPVANYITPQAANILDIFSGIGGDEEAKKLRDEKIANAVTQSYKSGGGPRLAPAIDMDSLRNDLKIKFDDEDIKKLEKRKNMNKNIKSSVDSLKNKTYNFNIKDLK